MVKSRPSQRRNTKKVIGGSYSLGHDSLSISPPKSHFISRYNAILDFVWSSNDTIKEEMITENNLGKHK